MRAPTRTRPEVLGTGEVSLDGQTVPYVIKKSPRARRMRLEVSPEAGLQVIIPWRCAQREALRLLHEKKGWIRSKMELCRRSLAARTDDGAVRYLGRRLRVQWQAGAADAVSPQNDCLLVTTAPGSMPGRVIEKWFHREAARVVASRLEALSAAVGVACPRFGVRSGRTRWGSCSEKGSLSFTWRLLMAPEPVIDYVVIHELLHLKEMNHSRRFWGLVERHCPGFRERRAWLKEHQMELVAPPAFSRHCEDP